MNNLFRHIEFLLLRHNCVILPGFGAFIASRIPARLDSESGMLLPPVRTYMFNQAVSLDDGLLANSYCRKYGYSFDEARQVILRSSELLKECLRENRILRFGNIGIFTLGEEDNISFSPVLNDTQRASVLGYMPIRRLHTHTETADVLQSPGDSTTSAEITDSSHVEDNSGYYNIRISKTFSKVAAILAIIMSVTLSIFLNPTPTDSRQQRASVVPVEALISSERRQHTSVELPADSTSVASTIQ